MTFTLVQEGRKEEGEELEEKYKKEGAKKRERETENKHYQ